MLHRGAASNRRPAETHTRDCPTNTSRKEAATLGRQQRPRRLGQNLRAVESSNSELTRTTWCIPPARDGCTVTSPGQLRPNPVPLAAARFPLLEDEAGHSRSRLTSAQRNPFLANARPSCLRQNFSAAGFEPRDCPSPIRPPCRCVVRVSSTEIPTAGVNCLGFA